MCIDQCRSIIIESPYICVNSLFMCDACTRIGYGSEVSEREPRGHSYYDSNLACQTPNSKSHWRSGYRKCELLRKQLSFFQSNLKHWTIGAAFFWRLVRNCSFATCGIPLMAGGWSFVSCILPLKYSFVILCIPSGGGSAVGPDIRGPADNKAQSNVATSGFSIG